MDIIAAARRPLPFESSSSSLWTDPWISQRMLEAHLDDSSDAASRAPAQRERALAWIGRLLPPGRARILDLGCGPGLYAEALAGLGHAVTGIDISPCSLEHARASAARKGLGIDYRLGDYLTADLAGGEAHDLAMMVYCDFGALAPTAAEAILDRVHAALAPGGILVFDVFGAGIAATKRPGNAWYVSEGPGFWAPFPHIVLESTFVYPCESCAGSQCVVCAEGSAPKIFRTWDRWFDEDGLVALLAAHGFEALDIRRDLVARNDFASSDVLFVAARRMASGS